ncbi:ABC transporter permease [Atopobium sp. oral taxon 416]|uniref:ABC transporter permease n=1 Tax=Atopobium sp. oral taxon 416 TaxID=712157 RepID=UPI001BAB5E43|nr:ABC transporter permease [Atopobium sp. oral taxon 416]QUC04172.1 ABC transporter permease [Atopobium sp. oral taxon 416]
MKKKVLHFLEMLILPALILVLWQWATVLGAVPAIVLPTPAAVVSSIVSQLALGRLENDVAISVSRILKGYALAVVFGLAFGVTMGMSEHVNRFFGGLFKAIRQIPMIAWVPLLVMWFGIGEESKVAVIFIAAFFQILLNTISGIQRTDKKLVEVGKMYQLSKWHLFREIYLPSALPSIFVGLKFGLSVSWMAVVGAEMIAASSGIGFRINDARALLNYPVVFSGMIAIAVAGVLMDLILSAIAKGCMPWERGEKHAS